MADIHVLESPIDRIRLAFHIPIPAINNDVGISYRTALVNSGIGVGEGGRRTILPTGTGPGQITTAEEDLLNAGEIFEMIVTRRRTNAAGMNARADSWFADEKTSKLAELQERLRFYGFTRNVP